MSENSTLQIHTQLTPEEARPVEPAPSRRRRKRERPRRTGRRTRSEASPARLQGRQKAGDRLLRNSAIACAMLLGILALGNVRRPWAQKAVDSIERALTMRINLDDSLGELTFVRRLMPESTLVFLNVSGGPELAMPVSGAVAHPWSALQPWLMFDAKDAAVSATGAGTVTAVSSLSEGQYGVLIDHGNGLESVYAGLDDSSVKTGDAVGRGQQIGVCDDGLYFELRSGGESVDPSERLGLK